MARSKPFTCLRCNDWFETKSDLKYHVCERVLNRDGEIIRGKRVVHADIHKEERRTIGERLKEIGVIQKRTEINFLEIQEVRAMLAKAEQELRDGTRSSLKKDESEPQKNKKKSELKQEKESDEESEDNL